MFLKNCWYVAAWSDEIGDGLFSRTLLDTPILFYRDTAGRVVALDNRCCHRAAPLSLGRLEGDCVRCMYHGLKFDPSGRCVEIPMQEHIPPQARVRAYPVEERSRWVWIWMGDPDKADPALLPDTHWLDDPGWRSLSGYMLHQANYLQVADNLCDFSHFSFVHPETVGGSVAYARAQPQVERLANGVRIIRGLEGDEPAPFVRKLRPEWETVDRWNNYDFLVPGVLLMDSGSVPVGRGGANGSREGALEFRSCQAVTPETADSTHYFFAQPHNFSIDDPEATRRIHQVLLDAFEEDRRIISGQSRMLAHDPEVRMVPLGVDAALSHFRWVMNKRIREEQAA
ncbi:Rieske 2Fe-2S domain-containing protein [Azoarcus indigens]|uniref:Vanillate O-demethylase monooxygenase subunit n=1 Tax=Azoarcus indigens TaxID=29545 RepID=A0A4R6DXJ9_9RHOO|nr:aromatic ring-hydroxylating dioxygenase subunit alpha [Azoarcus indigens]NMG65590.1 Rieske 2Fe-2S domain-containing protein [Azoarcus indigens]TDN50003.1 vanillate O-demethylase monooxygenase subunit [Azoarcus indigens]